LYKWVGLFRPYRFIVFQIIFRKPISLGIYSWCIALSKVGQGETERYHPSMKNILFLENNYNPDELAAQINLYIEYYNNYRYHEALNNLTPADVYYERNVKS